MVVCCLLDASLLGAHPALLAASAAAPCCPSPCCSKAEVQLEGEGPWALDGTPLPPAASRSSGGGGCEPDVRLVFTPGHTAGCISLFYSPDRCEAGSCDTVQTAQAGRPARQAGSALSATACSLVLPPCQVTPGQTDRHV